MDSEVEDLIWDLIEAFKKAFAKSVLVLDGPSTEFLDRMEYMTTKQLRDFDFELWDTTDGEPPEEWGQYIDLLGKLESHGVDYPLKGNI